MFARLPVVVICLTVLIDAIGVGLILPVMPDLLHEVTGEGLADSAIWGGILAALFAVMQVLFGPLIGAVSDSVGRRPVLLISLAVVALDYVVMALAPTLTLLVVGRLVGGVASATHATAAATMADVSRDEDRARHFGLIGAAFGMGFILGPLLGGALAQFGTRAPFWGAAGLAAANLALGLVVLPETVTARIRRPFRLSRANPLGAFRALGSLPGMGRLLAVFLLYQVALFAYASIWAFYGTARFGWDARLIGLSLAIYGVGMALVQGVLVAPVVRRLGDGRTVVLGMGIEILAFVFFAFVTSGFIAMALTPFSALGGLVSPALTAVLSRRARADQQGELQGVLASLNALTMIASPLVMTQVFSAFTAPTAGVFWPGAPFALSAVLMVGAMALFATRACRQEH